MASQGRMQVTPAHAHSQAYIVAILTISIIVCVDISLPLYTENMEDVNYVYKYKTIFTNVEGLRHDGAKY